MNMVATIPGYTDAAGRTLQGRTGRFVRAAGMRWRVEEMGEGPVVLLLHGTGASTHSWRNVMPLLAQRFNVIAVDLPGHGLTEMPDRDVMSMGGMARAITSLLKVIEKTPDIIVGHSAGAAIAVRMVLNGTAAPKGIIGVNAALLPLSGYAGQFFAPLARMLARLPIVPKLFARRAFDRDAIERMIAHTGSKLDREGVDFYHRLAQRPGHVAAALAMMAEWDLPGLQRDLRRLAVPLTLIVGAQDRTIPPSDPGRLKAMLPQVNVITIPGGHLAHEEAPELAADAIANVATRLGVGSSGARHA